MSIWGQDLVNGLRVGLNGNDARAVCTLNGVWAVGVRPAKRLSCERRRPISNAVGIEIAR